MRIIPYSELYDDVIDRLDNYVMSAGQGAEMLRQKKQSPVVVARAISAGVIEFCRQINHTSVPALVQTVELQSEGITLDDLYGWSFPSAAMHEREDGGVISLILNGEQVDFQSGTEYDQVVIKSRLKTYTGDEAIFNVDINKRRIYTAKTQDVKARIFKRPHAAYAPSQNMFHGVTLIGSPASITLNDGIGGSVSLSGTPASMAAKVNAAESFAYSAEPISGGIQLSIRPYVSTDVRLKPTVAGGGFTLTDVGTIDIPIPYHFIDTIASTSFAILLDSNRRQSARQPQTDSEQ